MLELLRSWFEWVNAMPSSVAIRESTYGYIILLSGHAVSMAFFAGLIAMMDLRLVGAAFTRTPVTEIQRRLFPWQMATLAVVVVSGVALLYGQPMRYFGKVLFWGKLSLMVVAGINALAFHYTTYKTVAAWNNDRITPFGARLAGALSLALWAGVVILDG